MAFTVDNTKINISIPCELLSQVEEFAQRTNQSKSGFICQAVRKYIDSMVLMWYYYRCNLVLQ